MHEDQDQRLEEVERRLSALEAELSEQRGREKRGRWTLFVLAAVMFVAAYLAYLRWVSHLG